MKIKRKDLNILIENYLYEGETGPIKGRPGEDEPDDFNLEPEDEEGFEDYVRAVDAYRYPQKPVGPFPNLFRNQDPHIPDDEELKHVRDYQQYQEIDPSGLEFGVGDDEKTVYSFEEDEDTDEDTEESPFGTQYSLEDTQKIPDYSDIDLDDIEDFGTFEDDSEDDSEDEEDEGIISKIRKFFSRK